MGFECFILSCLIGVVAIGSLVKYLKEDKEAKSGSEGRVFPAEQLLDMYERIYSEKADDQMQQLTKWRELAFNNCHYRREKAVKREDFISMNSNVSYLFNQNRAHVSGNEK